MQSNFEQIVSEAVKMAVIRDEEYLEKEMDSFSHVFSDKFNSDMDRLIHSSERKSRKVRKSKYLLIIAAVLTLNVAIVFANETLMEKFGNLVMYFFEDNADLTGTSAGNSGEFTPLLLNYVPSGYELTFEDTDNDLHAYNAEFTNQTGEIIVYAQESASASIAVTYSGDEKEIIEIDNMQCYLVSDTDYRTLIFESGGYIFTISSCEDKTELIKMAESVIGQTEDIQ